jgi:beta-N-acetylhexosaminidase
MKFQYLLILIFCSIQALTAQKSLDKQIGQMLLVGFRGMELTAESPIMKDIQKYHLGGVIYFEKDVQLNTFERNIKSPTQLKNLSLQLQKASKTPLFIAIDQEGGKVNRLKPKYGFPATITADSLGKINNLDSTAARALVIAQTLCQAGINLNFAPDVDLDTCVIKDSCLIRKGRRSFSKYPDRVTEHARAFIQSHHREGILTAIKHFPGHGSALGDTHDGFVDVTQVWRASELEPFRQLIASGDCDIVMTAHIFNAYLDPLHPATLSKRVLTDILREEYRYDGVIISDDMQMGAIAKVFGLERAIELALNAGVDILLFGNNVIYDPMITEKAFLIVKKLVKEGRVSKKQIKRSAKRIQKLKKKIS